MGEVYRGYDSRLDRSVAIKVLQPHLIGNEEARLRFEREARAIAAICHPNILAIHDIGSTDNIDFAVMEFLEGETLRDRMIRSTIPWPKAVDIVACVADGLAAAHAKGIIHRDIKPENIFLSADGWVKILDFGIAYLLSTVGAERQTDIKLTHGNVVGTTRYMSPKQLRGLSVD